MSQLITKDRLIKDLDLYFPKHSSFYVLSCFCAMGLLIIINISFYFDLLSNLIAGLLFAASVIGIAFLLRRWDSKEKKECIEQINTGYIECRKGVLIAEDIEDETRDIYWTFRLENDAELWFKISRKWEIPKRIKGNYWIVIFHVGTYQMPVYMLYPGNYRISSQITRI